MSTYTVTVTREDDLWIAYATDVAGKRVTVLDFDDFSDLHATMPEAIADMLNVDEVKVTWRYELDGQDVTKQMVHLRHVTAHLRLLETERDQARRDALATMAEAGLSQRAMADVVGVSHQRVNQLLKAS